MILNIKRKCEGTRKPGRKDFSSLQFFEFFSFIVKMKLCAMIIFILGLVQLCGSLNYFSTYKNLIEGVISFFSDHFNSRCFVVLQSDNLKWEENIESLKIIKYLVRIGSSFLNIPYELYFKYARYHHYKRTCAKMIVIILGWQQNSEEKFSEVRN